MASVRKFKKDLTYLVNEVISDCYVAMYFQPESSREPIIDIIGDMVELNNSIIDRINHPESKDQLKKYFGKLRKEMFDTVDAAFEKLSKVCAQKPTAK